MSDTRADELNTQHTVHLDGMPRRVLAVRAGDITGHRHLRLEGFATELHVPDHFLYPVVSP